MFSMRSWVLGACLVSCALSAFAASNTLEYQNQRGSTLSLTLTPGKGDTGTVSGTFTSAVGDCKADVGVPMAVSGFYNGNALAITENFPDCHLVAAMTGNWTDHQDHIRMLWLVTATAADPAQKDWNSNLVGTDFYTRVSHTS